MGRVLGYRKSLIVDPFFENVSLLMPLDNPSEPTNFVDNSKNEFSFEIFGTPRIIADGNTDPSLVSSKFGNGSAWFDGDNDTLLLSDNEAFNFGPSTQFTIEVWLYPSKVGSTASPSNDYTGNIISKDTFGVNLSWNLAIQNRRVIFSSRNGRNDDGSTTIPGEWWLGTNIGAISTGASAGWQHVAVTSDGTTQRIFVNGILAASKNGTIISYPGKITIGGGGGGVGGARAGEYQGFMNDLRVTKGIARYISNFTPPTKILDRWDAR